MNNTILTCTRVTRMAYQCFIQHKFGALLQGKRKPSPLPWVALQQPQWVYSDLCHLCHLSRWQGSADQSSLVVPTCPPPGTPSTCPSPKIHSNPNSTIPPRAVGKTQFGNATPAACLLASKHSKAAFAQRVQLCPQRGSCMHILVLWKKANRKSLGPTSRSRTIGRTLTRVSDSKWFNCNNIFPTSAHSLNEEQVLCTVVP